MKALLGAFHLLRSVKSMRTFVSSSILHQLRLGRGEGGDHLLRGVEHQSEGADHVLMHQQQARDRLRSSAQLFIGNFLCIAAVRKIQIIL